MLLNKFNSKPNIGITAPQINYYYEPNKIWSAGGKISKIRGSGFAVSDILEEKTIRADKSVEFVSGCCMLIGREVFERVGLFDENYFLYAEDTDLCFRVKKVGYNIYVCPESKIFHKVNQSTKNNYEALPLYYTTRNRLYLIKKNYPYYVLLTMIYLSITMSMKSLLWVIAGKSNKVYAVFRAFKDFLSANMGKTNHNLFFKNRIHIS